MRLQHTMKNSLSLLLLILCLSFYQTNAQNQGNDTLSGSCEFVNIKNEKLNEYLPQIKTVLYFKNGETITKHLDSLGRYEFLNINLDEIEFLKLPITKIKDTSYYKNHFIIENPYFYEIFPLDKNQYVITDNSYIRKKPQPIAISGTKKDYYKLIKRRNEEANKKQQEAKANLLQIKRDSNAFKCAKNKDCTKVISTYCVCCSERKTTMSININYASQWNNSLKVLSYNHHNQYRGVNHFKPKGPDSKAVCKSDKTCQLKIPTKVRIKRIRIRLTDCLKSFFQ